MASSPCKKCLKTHEDLSSSFSCPKLLLVLLSKGYKVTEQRSFGDFMPKLPTFLMYLATDSFVPQIIREQTDFRKAGSQNSFKDQGIQSLIRIKVKEPNGARSRQRTCQMFHAARTAGFLIAIKCVLL